MKALKCVETNLEIEFNTKKEADIILSSIKPEINDSASQRSFTMIECENKTLKIKVKAQDSASLRASLNSYIRWIILSRQILDLNE